MTAYSFDNAWEQARTRLTAFEARFDPGTIRHLTALGVAEGWRCLEVGAGGGSVAGWLARTVSPSGSVLATDLDPRFVEARSESNLQALRHDIVHEPLPSAEFHLVHARAVLAHLPQREEVLAKLVAALRPGGWLLCEDLDEMTIALVAPEDPAVRDLYIRVESAVGAAMSRRGADYRFGRRLPARLVAAGLVEVAGEGRVFLRRPGEDSMTARLTAEQLKEDMLASGAIGEAEYDAYIELLANPAFLAQTGIMVAAWGRRAG